MSILLSVFGAIFMVVGVVVAAVWASGGVSMALLVAGIAGVFAGSVLLVGTEIIIQLHNIYKTLLILSKQNGERGHGSIPGDSG